jgi:hypothetical protein
MVGPEVDESDADLLARLRVAVAAGRAVPADVAAWALDALDALLPALELVSARNRHLRAAATLVAGSTWAKASRLRAEIIAARTRRDDPAPGTIEHHVREALRIDPETPTSTRHLLRVLTDSLDLSLPPSRTLIVCPR